MTLTLAGSKAAIIEVVGLPRISLKALYLMIDARSSLQKLFINRFKSKVSATIKCSINSSCNKNEYHRVLWAFKEMRWQLPWEKLAVAMMVSKNTM